MGKNSSVRPLHFNQEIPKFVGSGWPAANTFSFVVGGNFPYNEDDWMSHTEDNVASICTRGNPCNSLVDRPKVGTRLKVRVMTDICRKHSLVWKIRNIPDSLLAHRHCKSP